MLPYRLLSLAAITALLLTACPSKLEISHGNGSHTVHHNNSQPRATVQNIIAAPQLLKGPSASGRVGDWLLMNEDIAVIISSAEHTGSFSKSGGNIIDASLRNTSNDALNEVLTYLDNTFPRQAVYTSVKPLSPSLLSAPAQLIAKGHDSDDPSIKITTIYSLEPTGRAIFLHTTLENTGTTHYKDFELGDAIQWGQTHAFAPGVGSKLKGKKPTVPWLASQGPGVSYGWISNEPNPSPMTTIHGSGWSDANIKTVQLPPNSKASYTRALVLGEGTPASLLSTFQTLQKTKHPKLSGTVVEHNTSKPIPNALVTLKTKHKTSNDLAPYTILRTDSNGRFTLPLPPNEYTLSATAKGRRSLNDERVDHTNDKASTTTLTMTQRGSLSLTVRDHTNTPIPAKAILVGKDNTPTPDFGPPNRTDQGALNRIYTHTGTIQDFPVPPGTYTLTVARGPEYSTHTQTITIDPTKPHTLNATLQRVVDTTGWLAADLHQHSAPSSDSSTLLRDRVLSNLAEGVEILVSTDHNHVTDFAPTIAQLNAQPWITSIVGNEVTTRPFGHFNAFPLIPNPKAPKNGAIPVDDLTPKQLFDALRTLPPTEKVIQVNHPRSGRSGYFDAVKLNSKTGKDETGSMSWNFDAIEIFNGKRVKDALRVMDDWFAFLNQGKIYTATGNSDTHTVVGQEPGYARTMVYTGYDNPKQLQPQDLVRTLRTTRRAVVTNGPFVTADLEGTPIGGTFQPTKRTKANLHIRVQAPPWMDVSRVEIIHNGDIIHTITQPKYDAERPVLRLDTTFQVPTRSPGWVIVRVFGDEPMTPILPASGKFPPKPFAFTNPIFIR